MLNENVLKGKWNEIKGDIQRRWGKLTNDDFERAKGDIKNVVGVIQQRYGVAQDEVRRSLDELLAKYDRQQPSDNEAQKH